MCSLGRSDREIQSWLWEWLDKNPSYDMLTDNCQVRFSYLNFSGSDKSSLCGLAPQEVCDLSLTRQHTVNLLYFNYVWVVGYFCGHIWRGGKGVSSKFGSHIWPFFVTIFFNDVFLYNSSIENELRVYCLAYKRGVHNPAQVFLTLCPSLYLTKYILCHIAWVMGHSISICSFLNQV